LLIRIDIVGNKEIEPTLTIMTGLGQSKA